MLSADQVVDSLRDPKAAKKVGVDQQAQQLAQTQLREQALLTQLFKRLRSALEYLAGKSNHFSYTFRYPVYGDQDGRVRRIVEKSVSDTRMTTLRGILSESVTQSNALEQNIALLERVISSLQGLDGSFVKPECAYLLVNGDTATYKRYSLPGYETTHLPEMKYSEEEDRYYIKEHKMQPPTALMYEGQYLQLPLTKRLDASDKKTKEALPATLLYNAAFAAFSTFFFSQLTNLYEQAVSSVVSRGIDRKDAEIKTYAMPTIHTKLEAFCLSLSGAGLLSASGQFYDADLLKNKPKAQVLLVELRMLAQTSDELQPKVRRIFELSKQLSNQPKDAAKALLLTRVRATVQLLLGDIANKKQAKQEDVQQHMSQCEGLIKQIQAIKVDPNSPVSVAEITLWNKLAGALIIFLGVTVVTFSVVGILATTGVLTIAGVTVAGNTAATAGIASALGVFGAGSGVVCGYGAYQELSTKSKTQPEEMGDLMDELNQFARNSIACKRFIFF